LLPAAGKSTLLDLLSGRKCFDTGGKVSLNGHGLTTKHLRALSYVIQVYKQGHMDNLNVRTGSSFVEQDDALLGTLTARETLRFALEISMPTAKPHYVQGRVSSVIEMLGLKPVQTCLSAHHIAGVSVAARSVGSA
jgi:ABC-type multidrug transport system ATPase subunit